MCDFELFTMAALRGFYFMNQIQTPFIIALKSKQDLARQRSEGPISLFISCIIIAPTKALWGESKLF